MIFSAPAIIRVGAPTVDRGLRLSFVTNEISDEQKLAIMKLNGEFGRVLFKPNAQGEFNDSEVPKEDTKDDSKSSSARLRAVLYVLWQSKGSNGDFQTFYRNQMEKFIEKVKENID